MAELRINGFKVDLENGTDISYTKQIADIFDIAVVSSSYTNAFTIPKTPNNTNILQGLGIVGDTSTVPYTKTPIELKHYGFNLVRSGLLDVKETSESYKIAIVDGAVELFKDLANKTIGVDLNLSNFNHERSVATVIGSQTNDFYKYFVADYGGKIQYGTPPNLSINIDYLVPSFSVVKLLELIFTTAGYTYDLSGLNDFISGLFITYPIPPTVNTEETILSANLKKNTYIKVPERIGNLFQINEIWSVPPSIVNEGALNGQVYFIQQSAGYVLNLKIQAYAFYNGYVMTDRFAPITVRVYVGGSVVMEFRTDAYNEVEREIPIFLNTNQGIYVTYSVDREYYGNPPPQFGGGNQIYFYQKLKDFHFNFVDFKISRIDQSISLTNAMKSFKITDFIKEIIWRTGATPIVENGNVSFLPIEDRLSRTNAVDWTDKFVRRTSEKYIRSSYAQRNIFKMKYNVEGQNENDGVLRVNNANIEAEKTLAQSVIYAPAKVLTTFVQRTGSGNITTPILPLWQSETKENSEGEIEISYKTLDNRYYFTRFKQVNEGQWRFGSETTPGSETNVNSIMVANVERTTFDQTIPVRYSQYEKIFDNFRAHEIELALGIADILTYDPTKLHYFKQEGKYYMINKLNLKEGSVSKAECIAVVPIGAYITITNVVDIFGNEVGVYWNSEGISGNFFIEQSNDGVEWVIQEIPPNSPISVFLYVDTPVQFRIRSGNYLSNTYIYNT